MVRIQTFLTPVAVSLTAVLIVALPITAVGQTGSDSPFPFGRSDSSRSMAEGELRSSNGFVVFRRKIQVPAEADGKLTMLNIDEGSQVAEGDSIGVIDDTAAKLMVEQKRAMMKEAELNFKNDVNRRFAVSSRDLAETEAKAFESLEQKKTISFFEKERKVLEAKKAGLQIELADIETKGNEIKFIASRIEEAMARHELDKRQIAAPFDGIIEERIAQQGEWVQAGSPIAVLVEMKQLKVEADLPGIGTSDRVYAGAPCEVHVYANGKDAEPIRIDSTLGFVSTEMNAVQGYRSWAVIDNQQRNGHWIIKPGMPAAIVIK